MLNRGQAVVALGRTLIVEHEAGNLTDRQYLLALRSLVVVSELLSDAKAKKQLHRGVRLVQMVGGPM